MKDLSSNPIVMIVVVIVAAVAIGTYAYTAAQPKSPPPGSYKPGVAPWASPGNKFYGQPVPGPGSPVPAGAPQSPPKTQ